MAIVTLLDNTRRFSIKVKINPALINFLIAEGIIITSSKRV